MLFSEVRFVLFFVVVFAAYWRCTSDRLRKLGLLLGSYVFYGAWDWRFLSLIVASTLIDFVIGRALATETRRPRRRLLLAISLVVNLGLLGFFKYFNFFSESLAQLLGAMGVSVGYNYLEIVLPVGISFYTFQTLSYTFDIYRGDLEPRKNLLDFALFVAFFPQLVAGPIVRAATFLPQLDQRRRWSDVPYRAMLMMFLIGYLKKAGISDNIAPYIDAYFSNPQSYDTPSAYLGTVLYAVQIYCDFSGYSDMAIACAGLLGYRFPQNFNFPYFASNIVSFWRRWHISLSSWLRDYLYITLGGNRGGRYKTYRNLMLTMLLGGLWHGASWNFVFWGALHGVGLAATRLYERQVGKREPSTFALLLSWLATFVWVCLAWVLFRSPDFATTVHVLRGLAFAQHGSESLWPTLWLFIGAFLALHALAYRHDLTKAFGRLPTPAFSLVYGMGIGLAASLANTSYQPFIYFQF